MDYKKLMEVAVTAGETMLKSGAETYRVEDTMNHILSIGGLHTADSYVLATGILATLSDAKEDTITVVRRVGRKETNLTRIYQVNSISRDLCAGRITLEETAKRLDEVNREVPYQNGTINLATVGICTFFAIILGGTLFDIAGAALVGILLAAVQSFGTKLHMNSILKTTMASFAVAVSTMLVQGLLSGADANRVIISAIMPLVPGMAFTNAMRDILYGDYTSGCARIMEAILIAAAVAVGVGAGISLTGFFGGALW